MKRKVIFKKRKESSFEKEKIELLKDIKKSMDDLKAGRFIVEKF